MIKMFKWLSLIFPAFFIIILSDNKIKILSNHLFGEARYRRVTLNTGNIPVPHERTIKWGKSSSFADSIYNYFAQRPVTKKMLSGKGITPEIILSKMLAGKDIENANKILLSYKPWGVSGSSWALNKKGDYDFVLTPFTTILWFFGDRSDILFPDTKEYLLNVLLIEEGNNFRYAAPKTLGLVRETENHLLMTEGSRYLKNRWLMTHGNNDRRFNNELNGMEDKILSMLDEIAKAGLYEFNSNPYIGYTIRALLNLDAFASEKVKIKARNVLDYINFCYALGSYKLKHYPPMRRRYEKYILQGLTTGYQSVFMKAWLSYTGITGYNTDFDGGEVHALIGACMPYRPPDKVVELLFNKHNGYFVRLGHGPDASPEIYSAGKHFLLSAGGVNRGKRSLIVSRPITLFMDDDALNLSETIHLSGPGTDFMKWNNTGVYRNFACAAGPVFVPSTAKCAGQNGKWAVYSMKDSVAIAVYSTHDLGLIIICENCMPEALLRNIVKENSEHEELKKSFNFPDGNKISYDVNAPKNKWVIISYNNQMLERDFDKWPLIEGTFNND